MSISMWRNGLRDNTLEVFDKVSQFDIIESKIIPVKLPAFPQARMIRFIAARNKK